MADTPGVTHTPSHTPHNGGGSWFKKNKKVALLGGGGIVLLLASHKGAKQAGGSQNTNAALQAGADAAAQAQTDAALAADSAGAFAPGGVAPTTVDTGGGSYVGPGGNSPTVVSPPAVTVNVPSTGDTNAPGGGADLDKPDVDTKKKKAPPRQHGKPGVKGTAGGNVKDKHPKDRDKPKDGVTVHGRHFPGGKGAHTGPARKVNGNTHQDVTVNHGGHSTTHTSVNQGQAWIDNPVGKTPPSRGPQHTVGGAPARRPSREPAPRPATHPAHRRK